MKLSTSLIARRKSGNVSELFAAGTEIPSDVDVPQHIIDAYLIDESKPRKKVPMPKDYNGIRYSRPDGTVIDDWLEHQAAETKRFEAEWENFRYYDHTGGIHEPEVPQGEVRFYDTRSGWILELGEQRRLNISRHIHVWRARCEGSNDER
jgi:hypothetical protein